VAGAAWVIFLYACVEHSGISGSETTLVPGRYFVNGEPTDDVSKIAFDRGVGKQLWDLSKESCDRALAGSPVVQ
jgi:hypothetical protein